MQDKVQRLAEERARLELGGGAERVQKQHQAGKLSARERLDLLFDPGTFQEIGLFVKHRSTDLGMDKAYAPGDGVVAGYGRVDGRTVYAYSQDFTVLGGSLGEYQAKKICSLLDLALKAGCPVVGINDSGGARVQEGIDSLNGYGEIFLRNTMASGVIPQISMILGPCAGGAVYSPGLTDWIFMVDKISYMFITGPSVIKSVTGEEVTQEQLGGAQTSANVSGVAHFALGTEQEAFGAVRRLLSFIPGNNLEDPPVLPATDPAERAEESLLALVPTDPNKPYDVRDVIRAIADNGDLFEVQPTYAANMVVGFARLQGKSVGIIANQPKVLAGCIDINASDKAARFIRFCDGYNIPLVTFVDTPGYLPGTAQEYGGIIRHGAKLLYAYCEATVPKLTVVIRKAYGGAYLAMCSRSLGADQTFAWPTAEIAVMGAEGAVGIVAEYKQAIEKAADPTATRKEKVAEYRETFNNPFIAAARGLVDGVIDPRQTRASLIAALGALAGKRESRPAKKHGNFPV